MNLWSWCLKIKVFPWLKTEYSQFTHLKWERNWTGLLLLQSMYVEYIEKKKSRKHTYLKDFCNFHKTLTCYFTFTTSLEKLKTKLMRGFKRPIKWEANISKDSILIAEPKIWNCCIFNVKDVAVQSISRRDCTSLTLRSLMTICPKCHVPIICFPRLFLKAPPSATKIKRFSFTISFLQAVQVGQHLLDHSVLAFSWPVSSPRNWRLFHQLSQSDLAC